MKVSIVVISKNEPALAETLDSFVPLLDVVGFCSRVSKRLGERSRLHRRLGEGSDTGRSGPAGSAASWLRRW